MRSREAHAKRHLRDIPLAAFGGRSRKNCSREARSEAA